MFVSPLKEMKNENIAFSTFSDLQILRGFISYRLCRYSNIITDIENGKSGDQSRLRPYNHCKFGSIGLRYWESHWQIKRVYCDETFWPYTVTRSSADADKPARRVYMSVKVTKHSTIPYLKYSFLLCNSNFVFKIRYYDIRLQKMS